MLSISFDGFEAIASRLDHFEPELRKALRGTIRRVVERLQADVLHKLASGHPLHGGPRGKLYRSIRHELVVEDEGRTTIGRVGVARGSEAASFARLHEFGKAHVFVRGHRREGPEAAYVHPWSYSARRRSFLRPVLRADRAEILSELRATVVRVVHGR